MTDDFIGQTLGQYRIEAPLGSGGMGQVYRGVHRLLNRPAAIKVMQAHLAANPDFRARFLREAQAIAALKHTNIVEIYDFGEQDGNLYLVMELMTDGSLHTLLRRSSGQPLPLALGLDLMQQAAKGLAAAQALQMVHRDIKPDNLLLNRLSEAGQRSEQYVLKISDFGLARLAESGLTSTGVPMGTLAYMSPEQCQGKKLDGRSDLYSLGIVFYEVVTGYKPFQITDFSEALDKHVNVPPKPPREMRPYLSPGLEVIILRCLAKNPEERYASGTELVAALQRELGNVGSQTMTQLRTTPEQSQPTGGTILQPPGMGGTPPPVVDTLATYTAVPRIRVLDQGGQTLQVVEVKSQGVTIGRQPGNDLVLSDRSISQRHLQVMWDGNQVTVKDLGSRNGTLLEGTLLIPQQSQPWIERQMIRIGPYWLRLEGVSPAATQTMQRPMAGTVLYGSTGVTGTGTSATVVRSGRIGMVINPRMLTITPGQPATFQVTLYNLGSIVDWFTTTVEGVAPEWVQGAGQEVQLNPGTEETIDLHVNVARVSNNLAQEYPVTIRARSREQPNESGTVQARWNVLPFTEDALRLEPRRATGRGSATYAVALQNGGNTPAHYELRGEDDEQKMNFQFQANPVDLPPGREARVPLTVHTSRYWIGREQRQPFQIHARPAGSSVPLTAPGEFVNKPFIPAWVLPVVGAILAAAIALGAFFHVPPFPKPPVPTPAPTSPIGLGSGQTPTPTVNPSPTLMPSPTATPTPTPTPTPGTTVSPNPSPVTLPASNVTPIPGATNLGGAIGSQYVDSQDRLYFVEYSGNLSALDNVNSNPTYHVLGTGYTNPEDVVVTSDGNSAYVTERSGDLVRVDLNNPHRPQATVITSSLTIPHQIILDEAHNVAYIAQYFTTNLVKVDLGNGDVTPLSNGQNAIGLLINSDFSAAYITEQLSSGKGQLVRFDLNTGNSIVLVSSTTAPLFEMSWANANDSAILVTERDPANKVWYVDLTKSPVSLQSVAAVASRPSSVVRVSSTGLFPLLVCANSEIDELT